MSDLKNSNRTTVPTSKTELSNALNFEVSTFPFPFFIYTQALRLLSSFVILLQDMKNYIALIYLLDN